jgi:DNA primase
VATYRLGWAPDGWDHLARALGAPIAELEACGLGFTNRAGRPQDFFRARVLFPIVDERDRVIGFGGRKLPDAEGPKYQNSRDNVLYNKSKALYGLNWAKADVVARNQVVVCEGYTDVIGFARAGVQRAVATCGTALTEDHVRTLKRFTRHIVLAYDADEAGQSAAERVYAWERAHEIEFSVVDLPPGADPDELARSDPERLRAAVESPKRFLRFRMDRVLATADLATAEGRARAADAALQVIAEHPDALVRDQYVMDLEGPTRFDAERLRLRLDELLRAPRRAPEPGAGPGRSRGSASRSGPATDRDDEPLPPDPDGPAAGGYGPGGSGAGGSGDAARLPRLAVGVEREALRVAVADPTLAEAFLFPDLFVHPTARAAFEALVAAGSVAEAAERSRPEVAELLAEVAVAPSSAEHGEVLARLASEAGRRTLLELESEARSAPDPLAYADVIAWLKVTLDHLRQRHAEVETVAQLLAFLRDGGSDADGE